MKKTLSFLLLITLLSCKKEGVETSNGIAAKDSISTVSVRSESEKVADFKTYKSKTINLEDCLVNGHKVILSQKEFQSLYKKIDSTETHMWDCGNPFEWLDKEWMEKTYPMKKDGDIEISSFDGNITSIFCKNIEFCTNNNMVLFDFASGEHNSFEIASHSIKINENTTEAQFKKMFPNAIRDESDLDEVDFRLVTDEETYDGFRFHFKNGKLEYFTLWWQLC